MQPITPARRVERPPPPVSPPINIDSPDDDDESDATTESSYLLSQQFHTLTWPISTEFYTGRNSPIPFPGGMSPASSQQPTQTPESSLTAWSGAFVRHGFGRDNVNSSNPGGTFSGPGIGEAGGLVNGSRTSVSRDIATFNLLRANSGRTTSREGGSGGGGSGRFRPSVSNNVSNGADINTNPNATNAALTEANIDFLRRTSSNGSGRRPLRGSPRRNSGRPPKAHHTSNSPPHTAGVAATAATSGNNIKRSDARQDGSIPAGPLAAATMAAFDERWTRDQAAHQLRDGHIVSPVHVYVVEGRRTSDVTTEAAEGRRNSRNANQQSEKTIAFTAEAAGQLTATSVDAGHGTAPCPEGAQDVGVTGNTNEETPTSGEPRHNTTDNAAANVEPPPIPLLREDANVTPADQTNLSLPSAASRKERVSSERALSLCGRPRRALSRHQAQVLPAEVSAADMPDPVPRAHSPPLAGGGVGNMQSPTLAPVPSPTTAAAPSAASKRWATTSGRRLTGSTSGTAAGAAVANNSATAAPTPSTAVGSTAAKAIAVPVPSKRAATAASKTVPGAPSQYISGGRLIQAARRIAVTSPVDAPFSRIPPAAPAAAAIGAPKASERQSSITRDEVKMKQDGAKISVSSPADAKQTKGDGGESDSKGVTTNTKSNHTRSNADLPGQMSESLASCSVHTIPPVKARELRITQPPPPPPTPTTSSNTSNSNSTENKSIPRTRKSPFAAAAATPTPPQPPALVLQDESAMASNGKETPKRGPAKARSASPRDSDNSLMGPPTPKRSHGSGTSNPPPRSVTGSRSSNNTSREWNVNTSTEYALSVTSTQPPLSVRMPTSSVQWTQPTNGRSSSGEVSDRDNHEGSFTSTLSAPANHSVTENPENQTNCATSAGAATPAASHKIDPPQPLPTVDGAATASATTKMNIGEASPISRAFCSGTAPTSPAPAAAGTAGSGGPTLLISSPMSMPPKAALLTRRSSHTTSASAERFALADCRGPTPVQVGRRSSVNKVIASPSATAALTSPVNGITTKATGRYQNRFDALANGNANTTISSVEKTAKAASGHAPASSPAGAAATVVGGRQPPRMFPCSDVVFTFSNRATTPEKAASIGPVSSSSSNRNIKNNRCNDTAADAEKTASLLANSHCTHNLPAGLHEHGHEEPADKISTRHGTSGGDGGVINGPRLSPVIGRGFNVTRSTETVCKLPFEHPRRPGSHAQGEIKGDTPSRRLRQPSCKLNNSGENGDGDAGREKFNEAALSLPPALASGAGGESKDVAFHLSPLCLPTLTRFARTPVAADVTKTPPTPPQLHFHLATRTSDDVGQESSGSGDATAAKDANGLSLSDRRRRPVSSLLEDGARTVSNSNTSSTNNRSDTAHSVGSANRETPDPASGTRVSHKKIPQLRQRAPSMDLI